MTVTEYLEIAKNSRTPMFSDLVGHKPRSCNFFLVDFVKMNLPKGALIEKTDSVEVISARKNYVFMLYPSFILRTEVGTGTRRLYPYYLTRKRH